MIDLISVTPMDPPKGSRWGKDAKGNLVLYLPRSWFHKKVTFIYGKDLNVFNHRKRGYHITNGRIYAIKWLRRQFKKLIELKRKKIPSVKELLTNLKNG